MNWIGFSFSFIFVIFYLLYIIYPIFYKPRQWLNFPLYRSPHKNKMDIETIYLDLAYIAPSSYDFLSLIVNFIITLICIELFWFFFFYLFNLFIYYIPRIMQTQGMAVFPVVPKYKQKQNWYWNNLLGLNVYPILQLRFFFSFCCNFFFTLFCIELSCLVLFLSYYCCLSLAWSKER